jgi:hypothetical protein
MIVDYDHQTFFYETTTKTIGEVVGPGELMLGIESTPPVIVVVHIRDLR